MTARTDKLEISQEYTILKKLTAVLQEIRDDISVIRISQKTDIAGLKSEVQTLKSRHEGFMTQYNLQKIELEKAKTERDLLQREFNRKR